MRSLPAGRPSTQTVSPIPNPIATPAQRSANSTVWWWKNPLNPPPSQSQRRDAPARRSFYQTRRGCAGAPVLAMPHLATSPELCAVPAKPSRDRLGHMNGAVPVAKRDLHRSPPFADSQVDRGPVGELLAGRRALRDNPAFGDDPGV